MVGWTHVHSGARPGLGRRALFITQQQTLPSENASKRLSQSTLLKQGTLPSVVWGLIEACGAPLTFQT